MPDADLRTHVERGAPERLAQEELVELLGALFAETGAQQGSDFEIAGRGAARAPPSAAANDSMA